MGCLPVFVLYVIDKKDSEVIGVYTSLSKAVDQLIKSSGYTVEVSTGKLLRYGRGCNFDSLDSLHNHLQEQMEFYDFNIIYRIEQRFLEIDL